MSAGRARRPITGHSAAIVAAVAYVIHANLDCEATWSGLALPAAVRGRISLYGALLVALAPDDVDVELWTPAPIDPARWFGSPIARLAVGMPPHADLSWADPAARAANDRRLARTVAALPGSKVVQSVDEIDLLGPWVAKVPWTAAGRDRCRGEGRPTPEQRARLARLLAASGALVVEPWCDRVLDVGLCGVVERGGELTLAAPHGLVVDARGGFGGIDLVLSALEPAERATLEVIATRAAAAIARTGYAGPFGIDAFAYRDGTGARRFHAPCEINARLSFGHVARALASRHGGTRLGFAQPPPAGATVLIAPASDGVTAWIA
jgi:hypothetical protein